MDDATFQAALIQYPIVRRPDYCKSTWKSNRSKKDNETKKITACTQSSSGNRVQSVSGNSNQGFWDFLDSHLADVLDDQSRKKFVKCFKEEYEKSTANLNLTDLEKLASQLRDMSSES